MNGREKTRFGAKARRFREAQKMWGILGQIGAFGDCEAVKQWRCEVVAWVAPF
jgi:hypothetical protein